MRANVMYLESPAGVGFSVGASDADWKHNDFSQGADAFAALQNFFLRFPHVVDNDIWVSGESYGGIYVPMLTWQIHQANVKAQVASELSAKDIWAYKLRGFMVGNGCTNWKYDAERSWMDTLFGFDMIPQSLYDDQKAAKCDYNHTVDPDEIPGDCGAYYRKSEELITTINPYDLYKYDSAIHAPAPMDYARFSERLRKMKARQPTLERDLSVTLDPMNVTLTEYLSDPDVRLALHIPNDTQAWSECTYDPRFEYSQQEEASEWIYRVLKAQAKAPFPHPLKLMHYSGDTDGVVPTYGTKQWIEGLKWDVLEPHQPWKLKDEVDGDQVQGFVTRYDGLDFVTVKGVGHMAPQWNRQGTTGLMMAYVHDEDFLLVDPQWQ
jgi:carboxypeptidase C (cathepsin A)